MNKNPLTPKEKSRYLTVMRNDLRYMSGKNVRKLFGMYFEMYQTDETFLNYYNNLKQDVDGKHSDWTVEKMLDWCNMMEHRLVSFNTLFDQIVSDDGSALFLFLFLRCKIFYKIFILLCLEFTTSPVVAIPIQQLEKVRMVFFLLLLVMFCRNQQQHILSLLGYCVTEKTKLQF